MSNSNTNLNNDDAVVNTLGTLELRLEDNTEEVLSDQNTSNDEIDLKLSPEDQFQKAFDNIRVKKYDEAEISLKILLKIIKDNQLSGSAHYWLGELYILKSEYRDAALVLAEGFQLYPESIKSRYAFKLSNTLFELNKNEEACKTAQKFIIIDFQNINLYKKN